MKKYTKAEIDIIVLENVDIVTLSAPVDPYADPEKTKAYCCTDAGMGNPGFNTANCPVGATKGQWVKIMEALGK